MKKIYATAFCAVVAMGYFMVNSSKNEPMSELMTANVTALGSTQIDLKCEPEGDYCCIIFGDIIFESEELRPR